MDFDAKCQVIEDITDEVGRLHPLLENVFPKLPNVCDFEHTHGQYERGADFILEVENATTGRRSHIGIVVKCGKVGSGKVTDVEEQIKECSEERAFKVLKRVRCTEVWVFASGGYSERAKEKLQARFPGRNVEFFGPEDIARFVDIHYAYFWLNLPHDLGQYLQQLSTKLNVIDRGSSLLASEAEASYIELDTYERLKKGYVKAGAKPVIRSVDFIHEAVSTKIGLLEAEMGFGKSKLARRLALSLCNAESYRKTKTVPVFSTYKGFADHFNCNLSQLIRTSLGTAETCLEDEKTSVLVILDGLDECSSPEKPSAELFDDLVIQAKEIAQCRLLVTTRPLKSLVDKATLYGEARTFGIRPLSISKIVHYLEGTCAKSKLPQRLFEDLKRSPLFKQLPKSPIAAALFSNLLNQSQHEVPQSLTELYAKSTELMLGRWEQKKELATEKQFKTAQLIAEQLAAYFVEHRLVYVAKGEVDQIITDYLERRNIGIEKNTIDALLFSRSTLFTSDDDTGTVAFRHRSFAEYLCAQRKARDRSLSVKNAALDPYWTNVFFFYVGTLLDCGDALTELRQLEAKDEVQEWMKVMSIPSYLLAAYQTEFDEVEANVLALLIEAARLFLRVRRGDTKTRLTDLTEMQLLYLFKSLIAESLGYDFFNRGFETIAVRLDETLEDPMVKAYALFFLSCAALECGSDVGFKFLLHSVGTNSLPLPISFAARCELESATNLDKSNLLRHHKDKLRKMLTTTGKTAKAELVAVQSRIDELFQKPLSARVDTKAKEGLNQ